MKNTLTGRNVAIILGLLVFAVAPLWAGNYGLYVLQRILLYSILALGLNVFMGHCGQANFGAAGSFALGAYVFGLQRLHFDLNFAVTIFVTLVVCGVISYFIAKVLLRLREFSLALGTFAFATLVFIAVNSLLPRQLAGGSDGTLVPPPVVSGHTLGINFNYYFTASCLAAVFLASGWIAGSRVGRAWHAIREDEVAASVMGIDVVKYKTLAFVITGTVSGLGGILLIQQTAWLSPAPFATWTNALILLIVVVGGLGKDWGVVVGGLIIVLMGEALVFVQVNPMLLYGVVLFLALRFMPSGVATFVETFGNRRRTKTLQALRVDVVPSESVQ